MPHIERYLRILLKIEVTDFRKENKSFEKCVRIFFVLILFSNCSFAQPFFTNNMRPDWSPIGAKIIYSSNSTGNYELYVISPVNQKAKRITYSDSDNLSPVWSPDGRKIAYSSNQSGLHQINIMDSNGENIIRLPSKGNARNPSWSPNGEKIVFVAKDSDNCALYVVDVITKKMEKLIDVDDWKSPSWSIDGSTILFDDFDRVRGKPEGKPKEWGLFFIDLKTKVNRPFKSNIREIYARWSPDGKRIAFTSKRDGNYKCYISDVEAKNIIKITNSKNRDYWLSFSHESEEVVFPSNRFGNFDLFIKNLKSHEIKRLTYQPQNENITSLLFKGDLVKAKKLYRSQKLKYKDFELFDKRNLVDLAFAFKLEKKLVETRNIFKFLLYIHPEDTRVKQYYSELKNELQE